MIRLANSGVSPSSDQKRRDLLAFIERELAPVTAVQAVVAIGSVGVGLARPDSDIDAAVFLEPFDPYIVPAEFTWRPSDGSFHSIYSQELGLEGCPQFDFFRVDLMQWADPAFVWPEERCAELSEGWLAFDRTRRVADLIAVRTQYPASLRQTRLDEAIVWLDQHLGEGRPERCWDSLGPTIAHDRLHAAYGYLVQSLFAYNWCWRPWRNREMTSLVNLRWLPADFAGSILTALTAPAHDCAGYMARVEALRAMFGEMLHRLVEDGEYGNDVVSEAFIRSHDQPGRAWNMSEWNARRRLPLHN